MHFLDRKREIEIVKPHEKSAERKETVSIMSTLAVCRVCLARNIRMHIIANTQLQTTFEKLSGIKVCIFLTQRTYTEDYRSMITEVYITGQGNKSSSSRYRFKFIMDPS